MTPANIDIKICGLKTADALEKALESGASHVGFIFFPKSPRHLTPLDAAALRERVAGRAKTVAVTVDADDATLDEIVATMKPDILQLHGKETPERVAEVRKRYSLPVMKAFSIREAADLAPIPTDRMPAELRSLTQSANDLLLRLAQSFQRERRFTANAAHELRTPIAALLVHLENALAERPDDVSLQNALTGARRMRHKVSPMYT